MWATLTVLLASIAADAGPWRTGYVVYRPHVERHYVVNAFEHRLKYNHDTSVAWFKDRWFYLWNANTVPLEGKPGQLNYVSTSRDGRQWSEPVPAFSSPSCCVNPIDSPGVQWQPNLAVIEGELWASWCLMWRDDHAGCYVSRLRTPDGKWHNEKLSFSGRRWPVIDGAEFQVFPTQNPFRLRSGRLLVPVTLIGPVREPFVKGDPRADRERRDSVLYTDDLGKTWHVSPGAVLVDRPWGQWEPTVWETPDGTVMMLARDLSLAPARRGSPVFTEGMARARSTDGGATWTPKRHVPMQVPSNRMHVLPAGGDRFLMVQCDWASGRFLAERYNVALFSTRGGGIDFVAGPGITGMEKEVMYPQMWVKGEELLVSYSQGRRVRSPKVAIVSPLPRSDRYYLFPRTKPDLESPAPLRVGNAYAFHGFQKITTRQAVKAGADGFSLGAWLRPETECVVFDSRVPGERAGLVWGLSRNRSFVFVGSPEQNVHTRLTMEWDTWNYAGVTVDRRRGQILFVMNDQTETLPYTAARANALQAAAASIGMRRTGGLLPYTGDVRFVAAYPAALDAAQHQWLHNRFAREMGREQIASARRPAAEASLWMDPANEAAFGRDFVLPPGEHPTFEVDSLGGVAVVRVRGEASAGVDVDENDRQAGDVVRFRFRFRIETGDEHVLLTVGDALNPARLVTRGGAVCLATKSKTVRCGTIRQNAWTNVELVTGDNRAAAAIDDRPIVGLPHNPQANWLYLGQGFRQGTVPQTSQFVVDLSSVQSRVDRSP